MYEGQFLKGEFHGQGDMIYPNGGRYQAEWVRGCAVNGQYQFKDSMDFLDQGWTYMTRKDRRFFTESDMGGKLQPAGRTYQSNDQPTPKIPPGTYDVGHGYYDSKTNQILSYDGSHVVHIPREEERIWIMDRCRVGLANEDDADDVLQAQWEAEMAAKGDINDVGASS